MNANGQRLLELCCQRKLCITNTFFEGKSQYKATWCHPRSKRWHQLDYIISRRESLKNVINSQSYHSAECDTDHALVRCKIRLQPQPFHHSKPASRPRIDCAKTTDTERRLLFTDLVENSLKDAQGPSGKEKWNTIREAIYTASVSAFGKRTKNSPDWFNDNLPKIEPLVEAKRKAFLAHKANPTPQSLQTLKTCRSSVQRAARQCANDYWLKLCDDIQCGADRGDIRAVYNGIKKAVGPVAKKTAPLKSLTGETICDRESQMKCWVEHFSELYSRETVVSEKRLEDTEIQPEMTELHAIPTADELSKAIL